ncbi:F-box protein PP2-A13-like [Cynara cardunculus var. scolymus]|uniref:F-box protein PP2-A13-like n=1 Tax=Cynara cardunculus var. scolymus TaxID=59895 RepID=UPI000D6284BF|nr:F-box protein PP2-A13-like [Cynara cardunculus var. scolymus]
MGSGFSAANNDGSPTTTSKQRPAGLGDLPENCLAMVLACLDPPDICNLARTNRAFYRASSADFIWEPKLPENYRNLAEKLIFYEGSSLSLGKKDIYAGLCCPIRFSSGTKEVWMEKRRGGICMVASWKGMKITGIDDRRYWTHIPTLQSRFHAIAYLQQIWWLEVEGDLEFEFPAGTYSFYFRLQLGRPSKGKNQQCSATSSSRYVHGWNIKPVRFQFSVSDGQHATSERFLNEQGKWLRYHVGDFVIEDSYKPVKIKYSMTQIDCTHQKGGLALDSVLICRNQIETRR